MRAEFREARARCDTRERREQCRSHQCKCGGWRGRLCGQVKLASLASLIGLAAMFGLTGAIVVYAVIVRVEESVEEIHVFSFL